MKKENGQPSNLLPKDFFKQFKSKNIEHRTVNRKLQRPKLLTFLITHLVQLHFPFKCPKHKTRIQCSKGYANSSKQQLHLQ